MILASFILVSCGASRANKPPDNYFAPAYLGDGFETTDSGWILTNIFGDGVMREVCFSETEGKSSLIIRKPGKQINDLLIGPRASMSDEIVKPTLLDLTGDKVAEIIWPTKYENFHQVYVLGVLGGPVVDFLRETPIAQFEIRENAKSYTLWISRPIDVYKGLKIPWEIEGRKLLPRPFQPQGSYAPQFVGENRRSPITMLWSRFFDGTLDLSDEKDLKSRFEDKAFGKDAKLLYCYICWDDSARTKEGDELFRLSFTDQSIGEVAAEADMFAHKANLELMKGNLDKAFELAKLGQSVNPENTNMLINDILAYVSK